VELWDDDLHGEFGEVVSSFPVDSEILDCSKSPGAASDAGWLGRMTTSTSEAEKHFTIKDSS